MIEISLGSGALYMARDLNGKHPFWNSVVCNLSGAKPLNLLHVNEFESSASQCRTLYFPKGNGDVLDIYVHKKVQLSDLIDSDTLDSDHLPIVLHLLDRIKTRNLPDPVDIFTDWERFQGSASELISTRIQVNWEERSD
jgi:hypothetical protein